MEGENTIAALAVGGIVLGAGVIVGAGLVATRLAERAGGWVLDRLSAAVVRSRARARASHEVRA